MTDQPKYTHTVFDNTTNLREDFTDQKKAIAYANKLLAQGHKINLRPYKPKKRYIDIVAERGPDG